jgi:hypothetical protein
MHDQLMVRAAIACSRRGVFFCFELTRYMCSSPPIGERHIALLRIGNMASRYCTNTNTYDNWDVVSLCVFIQARAYAGNRARQVSRRGDRSIAATAAASIARHPNAAAVVVVSVIVVIVVVVYVDHIVVERSFVKRQIADCQTSKYANNTVIVVFVVTFVSDVNEQPADATIIASATNALRFVVVVRQSAIVTGLSHLCRSFRFSHRIDVIAARDSSKAESRVRSSTSCR